MTEAQYLSEFGEILLFIIGAVLFVLVSFLISRIVRPDRPNPEKLSSYETGEESTGPAWTQFNIRFYIVALILYCLKLKSSFFFHGLQFTATRNLLNKAMGCGDGMQ